MSAATVRLGRVRAALTRPVGRTGTGGFRFIDPTELWAWRPLVWWSLVTLALEMVSVLGDAQLLAVPTFVQFGSVPLSLATLAAIGGLWLARARPPVRFGTVWWTAAGVGVVVLVPLGWVAQGGAEVAGIVAGSAVEEVVYRLALPVVVIAACRRVGLAVQPAVWVAFVVSTVVFTFLPGHVQQARAAGTLAMLVVVAAMGLLWFGVVWRGGSLSAAVVCHALVNLTILPAETGLVSFELRSVTVAALVLAVTVGVSHAVRSTPRPRLPGPYDRPPVEEPS